MYLLPIVNGLHLLPPTLVTALDWKTDPFHVTDTVLCVMCRLISKLYLLPGDKADHIAGIFRRL